MFCAQAKCCFAQTESSGDRIKNCNENKKRDTQKKCVTENGEQKAEINNKFLLSMCCIVGNCTCFSLLMFLSSKKLPQLELSSSD